MHCFMIDDVCSKSLCASITREARYAIDRVVTSLVGRKLVGHVRELLLNGAS